MSSIMRRFILVGVMLAVVLAPGVSHAQAPWPPDPAEIFAEGVEVVATEIVVPQPNTQPYADNEAHVVYVYDHDTQGWREYPYPDEVPSFFSVEPYTAEILLLSTTRGRGVYGNSPDPAGQWFLDINTGEFSLPELVCGEIRALPNQGRWVVFYEDYDAPLVYLCNTETGERTEPLQINDILDTEQYSDISPDGKRVILFSEGSRVYVYNLATGELWELGHTDGTDIRTVTWIDDTQALIFSTDMGDMVYPWQNYYLADTTYPDGLEYLTTIEKPFTLTQLESPPRYEWVARKDDGCYLVQLNLETAERQEYALHDLCSQGTILSNGNGDRLYYEVNWTDQYTATSASLIRFNLVTEERIDLLTGEIEWLEDISPDGRYAVLLLDNSGLLDTLSYGTEFYAENPAPEERRLRHAIIDLSTEEIVYETPTEWDTRGPDYWYISYDNDRNEITGNFFTPDLLLGPEDTLFAIGNELFLHAFPASVSEDESTPRYVVVNLTSGQILETPIMGQTVYVLHDGLRLVFWTDGRDISQSLSVYDVLTGKVSTLVNPIPFATYQITPEVTDTDLMSIHVDQIGDEENSNLSSIVFTIRIS